MKRKRKKLRKKEITKITTLSAEKIWQELYAALTAPEPQHIFMILHENGLLKSLLPEVNALYGIPNPSTWHPEIDSGVHVMLALQVAAKLTDDPQVRFAVLVHDVGKIKTPRSKWPHHPEHEKQGITIIKQICKRLHIPHDYEELAILVAQHHGHCRDILKFGNKGILRLLNALDAVKKPERFAKFLLACQADAQGRTGREHISCPHIDFLQKAQQQCAVIATKYQTYDTIHKEQLHAIKKLKKHYQS